MSWTVHTLTITGGANCLCEPQWELSLSQLHILPTCRIMINCPTPKQWSILRTCTAAHVCCIIIVCSIMFTVSGQWHQPTGIRYGLCSENTEQNYNAILNVQDYLLQKDSWIACMQDQVVMRLGSSILVDIFGRSNPGLGKVGLNWREHWHCLRVVCNVISNRKRCSPTFR